MKCEQEPKFQPITIILETAEEAEVVWAALEGRRKDINTEDKHRILKDLADWFCQEASVG